MRKSKCWRISKNLPNFGWSGWQRHLPSSRERRHQLSSLEPFWSSHKSSLSERCPYYRLLQRNSFTKIHITERSTRTTITGFVMTRERTQKSWITSERWVLPWYIDRLWRQIRKMSTPSTWWISGNLFNRSCMTNTWVAYKKMTRQSLTKRYVITSQSIILFWVIC